MCRDRSSVVVDYDRNCIVVFVSYWKRFEESNLCRVYLRKHLTRVGDLRDSVTKEKPVEDLVLGT